MKYRDTILLSHEALAATGTRTLDITVKDIISSIDIQIKATNSDSTPIAHPAAIISKIELVDGSDVLFGLSGAQAMALSFYDQKRTPFCVNNYLNGAMSITNYQMNFGRWLWDELLAFDPKKFQNPQLKVTYSRAAGGSSPSAATIEVNLHLFDEKEITPVGFLMNKEVVGYTLSGGSNERVDLPLDYDIRKVLILSLYAGKQPWEQYNTVKLSEDNDKRVPINDSTSDLIKYLMREYPEINEYIVGQALSTAVTHFMMSAYEPMVIPAPLPASDRTLGTELSYGGSAPIIASDTTNFIATVRGLCPHGALCLPFGRQDDMADWYKVAEIGKLELIIKAGGTPGANSTCEVVTQQLRTYP